MLYTASFYQPESWVGRFLRVSRYHPRGRRVQWDSLPFFYPQAELIKAYRSGQIGFDAFTGSYRATLEERYVSNGEIVRWLETITNLGDFTLLCYEREEEPCHRRILARWLKKKVPALELGILR